MPHTAEARDHHSSEWITTKEAAKILNRSPRQTLDLVKQHQLPTHGAVGAIAIDAAAVRALKVERDKPRAPKTTLDVGERAPVKAERPKVSNDTGLGLAALAEAMRTLRTAEDPPPAHRWVTLKEAAAITGLSKKLLAAACDEGRLPSLVDGAKSRPVRKVKVEDLLKLRP